MKRSTELLAVAAALAVFAGCHLKREPVSSVPHLAYPDCGHGPLDLSLPGETVGEGELYGGEELRSQPIVERFGIVRRDCLVIGTARVERPYQLIDLEIVWDAHGKPLRVWRRITVPGSRNRDGDPDITLYELRTHDVTITHRAPDGTRDYARVRGRPVGAVITESRGLLSPWLAHADILPGESSHARTLDTGLATVVENEALLARSPDLDRPAIGRRVRVYKVYGRDAVFTDDHDVVVGDLAGLVPASRGGRRPFPPMPMYGGADPVGTP